MLSDNEKYNLLVERITSKYPGIIYVSGNTKDDKPINFQTYLTMHDFIFELSTPLITLLNAAPEARSMYYFIAGMIAYKEYQLLEKEIAEIEDLERWAK